MKCGILASQVADFIQGSEDGLAKGVVVNTRPHVFFEGPGTLFIDGVEDRGEGSVLVVPKTVRVCVRVAAGYGG